jgi:hypothetical protein
LAIAKALMNVKNSISPLPTPACAYRASQKCKFPGKLKHTFTDL